jgi:hypothetical protein
MQIVIKKVVSLPLLLLISFPRYITPFTAQRHSIGSAHRLTCVERCLWQEKAYDIPPIPKSWVTDSDDEDENAEDDADVLATWLEY